jgi:hypothetical protein
MRFAEIDLLGVYVAPIFVMMLAAWPVTMAVERLAVRVGLMRHIWHPFLFLIAVYVAILSAIVLLVRGW